MSERTQRLRDNFIKAIRLLGLWFIIFLIAVAILGGVFYAGIAKVPSTATYFVNFNNLETIKNWNDLKKAKPKETKKKKEPAALEFPVSARINDYGFIGLKKGLLKALGWKKDMALKIKKNADGSATIRKA